MRIENEMLSRLNDLRADKTDLETKETTLSKELDFFFDNVMGTIVDYFKEEVTV